MRGLPAASGLIIRSGLLQALVTVCRFGGGQADALIARYKLPPDVEARSEIELPLESLRAIGDEVAAQIGDPFIGLHLATMIDSGQFGMLEFMLRSAGTLRQACGLAVRYSGLVNELTRVTFGERDGEAILDEHIPGEPLAGGRQSNEFVIVVLVRFIRICFGADWHPQRVWFAHAAPADITPLVAYLGTDRIEFGTGSNGFACATADLDLPNMLSDLPLLSVLEQQAQAVVAERSPSGSVTARVREHVRIELRNGPVRLSSIAKKVGTSPRSLQRMLRDHDTTFEHVIDDVRSTLARLYVVDRKLTLGDCAYLLGYSELRALLRAFRRWTGTTPTRYREAHAGKVSASS